MKECLLGKTLPEIKNLITELGEKSFRAGQIYKALHMGLDFSEMTEISKDFRQILSEKYSAQPVEIIKALKSVDGTEKFLYKLLDGNVIEGEEEITKKVMSAVTDPGRIKKDDLGNPDVCMVAYYQYLVPIALGRERSVVLVTGSRKKKD